MSVFGASSFTDRITFFDGQRLFASDLEFLEQFNREMRWLHNRSLHQAGIGSGFAVAGNKGDRQVRIEPGYAIDDIGREIVLTQPQMLQVPPVANDSHGNPVYYMLTVAYRDDRQLPESETRDGVCVSRSAVRLRETPVFCWVELVATSDPPGEKALTTPRQTKLNAVNNDLQTGRRIALAAAEVLNCQLNQPLSLAQRRNAKPPAQPFLWAGRTKASIWNASQTGLGITVITNVDISAAPFRTTPRYFAHAVGDRNVTVPIPSDQQKTTFTLDGFPRVKPITTPYVGFEFSLLIPLILIDTKYLNQLDKIIAALKDVLNDKDKGWYVEWLGIEG
jgi:hypothetical protein